MTSSPNEKKLLSTLFGDETIETIFSDEQFVQYMLDVESALAMVQGKLGIIPPGAAAQIIDGAKSLAVDYSQLNAGIEKAGVPVPELVRQMQKHIGEDAADFVHWGATSQDIMDTALVLQIQAAVVELESMLQRVIVNLAQLADQHRDTLMAGRTHSQVALPIVFGFKVAGWLTPLLRHRRRLAEIKPRLFVIQFGGAVGTLAAYGSKGPVVKRQLAEALNLAVPLSAWHTHRDTLAEFSSWLSLVTGSLGKMAQDIILMAQSEVGEVRESADLARGGSSAMPQKSNPMVSEAILAIHRNNVGHLCALHNALVQEHERATSSWQVEWLNLPPMVGQTAAALSKAAWLIENLVINSEIMRENVTASKGMMLSEAISYALSEHMPRAEAKTLIRATVQRTLVERQHLVDMLQEQVEVPIDWESLRDEQNYLGSAVATIDDILKTIE